MASLAVLAQPISEGAPTFSHIAGTIGRELATFILSCDLREILS